MRRLGPDDPYSYYKFELRLGERTETSRFFIIRYPPDVTAPFFEATLDQIRRIAAAVTARGMRFALVINPRYQLWDPEASPRNWETREYDVHDPYTLEYVRFFEGARDRVSFPIYSLLDDFRAWTGGPLVFEHDPHLNELGSDLAAKAIAGWIASAGLLP